MIHFYQFFSRFTQFASIPCAVLRRQVSTYFVSEAVEKRAQDLPLALGFKECSRTTCLALGFDGPYRFAW